MKYNMKLEVNAGDLFSSIDELCRNEASNIMDAIKSKVGFSSELFTLHSNAMKLSAVSVQKGYVGIYMFMFDANAHLNSKSAGVAKFDSVSYAAKTNNNLKGTNFQVNDCLYLGKSEKNLYKRIVEHVGVPSGKKTYSLRLGEPERKHIKSSLCLYTFVLKKEFKKYKKVLLPIVEGYLHDLMLPKVGSKRT